MAHIEDAAAGQLLARSAGDGAGCRIDAQPPPLGIDLGDADGGVLVGDREAQALLPQDLFDGVIDLHASSLVAPQFCTRSRDASNPRGGFWKKAQESVVCTKNTRFYSHARAVILCNNQ
jgi:hypothetical protein